MAFRAVSTTPSALERVGWPQVAATTTLTRWFGPVTPRVQATPRPSSLRAVAAATPAASRSPAAFPLEALQLFEDLSLAWRANARLDMGLSVPEAPRLPPQLQVVALWVDVPAPHAEGTAATSAAPRLPLVGQAIAVAATYVPPPPCVAVPLAAGRLPPTEDDPLGQR